MSEQTPQQQYNDFIQRVLDAYAEAGTPVEPERTLYHVVDEAIDLASLADKAYLLFQDFDAWLTSSRIRKTKCNELNFELYKFSNSISRE